MAINVALIAATTWATLAAAQGSGVQVPLNKVYRGGLTILSDNDLSNSPRNGSAAVLVHQLARYQAAKVSCHMLNETVWNPDSASFTDGLNSSLSYQIYQGVFAKTQLFWVSQAGGCGSSAGGDARCRAMDYLGKVKEVDCITSELPALCTQSAPVSTSQTNNDPTPFLVNQTVGASGLVYQGFRDHFVWKFRGVRYAQPPTRWEHSTLYEPTASDLAKPIPALNAVGDCLQRVGEVQSGSTEDCLFVNIWTPHLPPPPAKSASSSSSTPEPKLKPVMFYIYGGGFTSGSWKNSNTDGTMLASRGDVVVVSINYRVSSLGWLAFDDGKHKGNYGLGDLITGLEWVKRNIASFGGDPARVTIFGESAGAMLVRALLASPKAEGLFYAAISQSGPTGLADNEAGNAASYGRVEGAYDGVTTRLLNATGCLESGDRAQQISCLRAIDGTTLINTDPQANGLVVDGEYLISATLALNNSSGYTSDVAFMTGTNRDELGIDMDLPPAGSNLTDLVARLLPPQWRPFAEQLLRSPAFATPADPTPEQMLAVMVRLATDGLYTCLEQATAHTAGSHSSFRSVYSYQFNRTYNPRGYTKPHCDSPAGKGPEEGEYMKCHAGEQMVVFGTVMRAGLPDRDGLDVPFMRAVVDSWVAFAWHRDPNPPAAYLASRAYWSTLAWLERTGPWTPVGRAGGDRSVRLLQVAARMVGYTEREQCAVLGLPLGFFEAKAG